MRGAERSHAYFSGRPSGAPLAAIFLEPLPCALPLFPPRSNARQIRPGPYSARRHGLEPLRLLRYACARCEGNRGFRPRLPRAASGAAPLPHMPGRSGHASLMGKGWGEFKRGARGGDKFCVA